MSPSSTSCTISLVCGAFCNEVIIGFPFLHLSIFILLGSLVLSVHNNKLSNTFIPVMTLLGNFKTDSDVFALVSTNTALTPVSTEYSIIASTELLLINQNNLFSRSSETLPTHLALFISTTFSILLFPNIFCTVPISDPSDVESCTFIASLYCPFGTSLSSRSLFILP